MMLSLFGLELPLGQYLYAFQVLIAEGMFAVTFKRKDKFAIRVTLCLIAYLLLSYIVPALLNNFFTHNLALVFFMSIAIFPICFENDFWDMFFCCIAAVNIQNLAYNFGIISCLILNVPPDGLSGIYSAIVQLSSYAIVHVVCYFLCVKTVAKSESFGIKMFSLIMTAFILFLIIYVMEIYLDYIDMTNLLVVRIAFVLSDGLILMLLFGMYRESRVTKEKLILEQLIQKEYEQYEMSKKTIEIIGLKSHDIKQFITLLKNDEGIITKKNFAELEKSTKLFDHLVWSGNPALDIILTEKNLLCESEGITMTYMVDAEGLKIITAEDVASIFGNLLDNAIQYLKTIPDRDKRVIMLNVRESMGLLVIKAENYFERTLIFQDGLPMTTNDDIDHHGFGLKSVRYIVDKYGGQMTVATEESTFRVLISIPLENK